MSKLQEMRETWRPRLAHDLRRINWAVWPLAFASIIARPDAGVAIVSLVGVFCALLAGLYGIRQMGKNAGVSDA